MLPAADRRRQGGLEARYVTPREEQVCPPGRTGSGILAVLVDQELSGAVDVEVGDHVARGTDPVPSLPGNVVLSGRPSAQDLPEHVP